MCKVTRVLGTTNEVSLKGGNRKWFERKVTENVRRALADLPVESVRRPAWRVLITFSEPVSFALIAQRLATVFGLSSFMPVHHIGHSLEDAFAALPEHLLGLSPASFAVRCKRSDKMFPMTSIEFERAVGTEIQDLTGWPVDLCDPDLTVRLLIDEEGIQLWLRRVAGPGGLPSSSGGRAACLLSGGIDSPVAAYMAMKRGLVLDFIHFHSVPRTDPASLEKTQDLVRILARYQGRARLAMVPLLPIQEKIVSACPARFRVLLYRRFMVRISERLAGRFKSRALVTGESLGQVASQTIENLAAVESVSNRPILRPLISFDKQEIINIGRVTGTFEISIRPHFDCCSFLLPEHPATRSTAQELEEAESALDIDDLVREALRGTEILVINTPAPWEETPAATEGAL